MNNIEQYSFNAPATYEKQDGTLGVFSGWITRYGVISSVRYDENTGMRYRDTFASSAFSNISTDTIWGLAHHDWDIPFGHTDNKTLQLATSGEGVQYRLAVPDTIKGRDFMAEYKHGLIGGCSFGYVPDVYTWSDGEDMPVRLHTSGTLKEVSLVYHPAFEGTEVVLSSKTPASQETIASLQQWQASKAPKGTPRLTMSKQKLRIALI